MGKALNLIIGGDASELEKTFRKIQSMSKHMGKSVASDLAAGGSHMAGSSGIVNEFLVLTREVARGNWSRVPGSLSILASRMGLLKLIFKDTASSAGVLADAWEKQSVSASRAALAAVRKAESSIAALNAEGGETDANLEAAISDEAKARSSLAAAAATQSKAIASREAASAAQLEAGAIKMQVGALGTVVGVLAGIATGAYFANKLVRNLTDTLSGVKAPEFNPQYILQREQSQNAPAEVQRQINQEIAKSIDLYNSASKAAERVAEVTKKHFDNQREVLKYQKEAALAKAKTPDEKKKVDAQFTQRELKLNQDERAENITNMENERAGLRSESLSKQRKATGLLQSVGPEKADENKLQLAEARLATIKAADDAIQKGKSDPGFLNLVNGRDAMRAYNSIAATGVSTKDLDAAESQVTKDRVAQEKEVNRLREQSDAHALIREKAKELTQQAGTAAGKAEDLNLKITDTKKINVQTSKDESDLAAAKQSADDSKAEDGKKGHGAHNLDITGNQRIGAFIGGPNMGLLDVNRSMNAKLEKIVQNTTPRNGSGAHNFSGVKF